MKAVIYETYGTPDVLQLRDVEKPVPKPDEVLIKVRAVSLNASDWELLTGKPLYARIFGLFKPKHHILGSDVAGCVETVGSEVTALKPGDEVFGDLFQFFGGFAEYVCAPEHLLTLKPAGISFEQAAALPQAAAIALQGIRDQGKVKPGQNVLINGAGGSAGSFALQMAKHAGAQVTGVDTGEKLELMRSLGADHVIDYTKEDYTQNRRSYDLILDLAAHKSIFKCAKALRPKGLYLFVGGSMACTLQTLFLGPWITMTLQKRMRFLALKTNKDMKIIIEQIQSGDIAVPIDKTFTLEQVPEALRYIGAGHAKGKVVITL